MIAPDKIYVQPEWITGPERNYIYDTEPTPCAEEYIRKGALLEWAKKENEKFNKSGNEDNDDFQRGMAAGMGFLISTLINKF